MASAAEPLAPGSPHRAVQDPAQALAGHCFEVGGCVRDTLLGRAFSDRDWVVVGLTPERMLEAGFKPVGRDFPVFLHPISGEEYALARTERKSAPGYHGFVFHAAPEVTLEEDLARRDLSINAMARGADGRIVDPFGGMRDLQDRVLRHVSPAFAEDPVRLLRVARFAARFGEFSIAPATLTLMRDLVEAGEVDALVPERVWQELSRGLMEPHPQRMLLTLRECGALKRLLPEVDRLWGVPQPAQHHPEVDTGAHLMLVLEECAKAQAPLCVRWAAIAHDLGKGATPRSQWPRHPGHEERSARLAQVLADRLKLPNECRELADVVAREHGHVHASGSLRAEATLRLLKRCDALRRPERFALALLACECDARGRAGRQAQPYAQGARLMAALQAARGVNANLVAEQAAAAGLKGPAVGQRIDHARCEAIAALYSGANAEASASQRS